MTDSEKEIIRLLNEQNRLLRQLVEKDRPKYETKVDRPNTNASIENILKYRSNEKAETED